MGLEKNVKVLSISDTELYEFIEEKANELAKEQLISLITEACLSVPGREIRVKLSARMSDMTDYRLKISTDPDTHETVFRVFKRKDGVPV